MKLLIIIIFSLFLNYKNNAQSNNLDSLLKIVKHEKNTINKIKIYVNISEICEVYDIEKYTTPALELCNNQLKLLSDTSITNMVLKYKAICLNNEGLYQSEVGNKQLAITNFYQSVKISHLIKDYKGVGETYFNIGLIYAKMGKMDSVKLAHSKALTIFYTLKDSLNITRALTGLAQVYESQGNIQGAINNYMIVLKMLSRSNNFFERATVNNNLAINYINQGQFDLGIAYYKTNLAIGKKNNSKTIQALALSNMAFAYHSIKNHQKALQFNNQALQIRKETNDRRGMAISLNNLSNVYFDLHNDSLANAYLYKSYIIFNELQDSANLAIIIINLAKQDLIEKKIKDAKHKVLIAYQFGVKNDIISIKLSSAEVLSQIYTIERNWEKAFQMQTIFFTLKDSLNNLQTKKTALKSSFQIQYAKKETELKAHAKAEQEQLKLESKQQKQKQNIIIICILIFLLLVSIFSFFIFRSLQKNKLANLTITRQKNEVDNQKSVIEEKQKEIIDSINYAKRLQDAILPPLPFLNQHVPNHFSFYKPKDIVAGDFYWAEKIDDLFFIAVADSTGHGVPGAMVSVVCSNALNRAVKEFKLTDPGSILDKARELVIQTFEKSTSEVKDGMDISLLSLDIKNRKICWSGANNPLWYIQNNELIEIKANKQPIGQTDNPQPFTTHEIEFISDTIFYLFTDGFADQFGGPAGKKFKYKQFNTLLIKNSNLCLPAQAELLENSFDKWKTDLDQVDDVCIIGIKI